MIYRVPIPSSVPFEHGLSMLAPNRFQRTTITFPHPHVLTNSIVPIQSSTSTTPLSHVYQPTTLATSSFSPVTPAVCSLQSPNSTLRKPCSISSRDTPRRWLAPKMVSPSHKLPFLPASLSHSWLYTQCDTPRCWPRRSSTTRLTPGC